MTVVIFEDETLQGFGPLTMLRHVGQLGRGTGSLIQALRESIVEATELVLWGRSALNEVCKESVGMAYNTSVDGIATLVNARAKPGSLLMDLTSRKTPFVALSGTQVFASRVAVCDMIPGPITRKDAVKLSKSIEKLEVPPDSIFQGYWDLVRSNGMAIAEQAKEKESALHVSTSVEVKGPRLKVRVDSNAEVESHVILDTRLGPIVIGGGALIESFSRITGPSYIGPRTKIYSAQIGGGTSVFEGCKVGGQIENSIVMSHTNKVHYGYIGDSYIGEWVNLGAGSTFSNMKNTYGSVRLELGLGKFDTGMIKLGPVVGDMSKTSIGSLVYSGKSLGTGCQVAGTLRKNVPSFTYFGGSGSLVELSIESILDTQRRMMERRGKTLTRASEALIREAFKDSSKERKKAGVVRGRLS